MRLFVTQRFNRIDACGFACGVDAEQDTHHQRNAHSHDYGFGGDDGFSFGDARDEPGEDETEGNPDHAAGNGDHDRFDEELT